MRYLPTTLQGTLWSKPIGELDTTRDRTYIIHQILAFGTLSDVHWLFHTYDPQTIRDVFLTKPIKIYSSSAFHFGKLLLGISDQEAPAYRYDQSLPRHIG